MGDPEVELGEKEYQKIGEFVKSHLKEWMDEIRPRREFDLLERIVRVEEELKKLHAVMNERFEAMERRFEAVDQRFEAVEQRFEAVDQRFESMQSYMDKRFESMDKRFESMQKYMDRRFSSLQWMMGLGFTLMAALMAVFNFF